MRNRYNQRAFNFDAINVMSIFFASVFAVARRLSELLPSQLQTIETIGA